MAESKSTDKLEIINSIIARFMNDSNLKEKVKSVKIEWEKISTYKDPTEEYFMPVPNLIIEMKE